MAYNNGLTATASEILVEYNDDLRTGVFKFIENFQILNGGQTTASIYYAKKDNNNIVKNIVQRPRPFVTFTDLQIIIPTPSEFSFPSGHTSSSFAAAAVFYRHLPKKLGIPSVILAGLIGFSRLYVGVHYPTDVIAGVLMGILLSYLAEFLVNLFSNKLKKA